VARAERQPARSTRLTRNANEGIDMAPAVYDDTVYVSTVPGNTKSFYKGNGQGVLWALDAESGKEKWSFDTVPADLWSDEHTSINSGGGLWHPPAFDSDGRLFAAIANPAPWPGTDELPWGTSRPGPNLYTNSLVSLNPDDGSINWHYQVLPHDVYDWDLHLPPIVTEDDGRELVIASGKGGFVYAMDADDGQLLWKTSVGVHNGHDNDNALALEGELDKMPKLPVTVLPGALGGVETQMAVDDGVVYAPIVNLATTYQTQEKRKLDFEGGTGEMVALDVSSGDVLWRTKFAQPTYGAATVSNDLVFTTTFDGKLVALDKQDGKVTWQTQLPAGTNATVAIAGDTVVTAASYPQGKDEKAEIVALRLGAGGAEGTTTAPATTAQSTTATTAESSTAQGSTTGGSTGSAEGKSLFASNCGSCHTLADAGTSGTVGPNLDEAKPAKTAVAQKVENGGGGMPAFGGRLSQDEIDAIATYVASAAGSGGGGESGPGSSP
jgi:outer membrane protein assembly factor BamB